MKKKTVTLLATSLLALTMGMGAMAEETQEDQGAYLVDASMVTEVLDWGETVTALRLEYTEEIWCGAVENSNEHPGKLTYSLVNDRDIVSVYVNNSGEKDDIELTGKYVFLNLGIENEDVMTYRDQVVFNTAAKVRPALSHFYLFQQEPIITVDGDEIAPSGRIDIGNEIRIGIDDFETFTYTNEEDGSFLNYHLYIPEGYDEKSDSLEDLPLVVHFPSGDYSYEDDGRYLGALFSHPDALYWATDEAQAENPAFVVTVGGEKDDNWSNPFSTGESVMQQNYMTIVRQIAETYNVDTSRIYAISLAGGTNAMYYSILENPDLFAAQITTAYEPYHVFMDEELAQEKFGEILDILPSWLFAGLTDGSGAGCLGEDDTRLKGERLRDLGFIMNENGYNIDIAYGENGELMWNGLLRGEEAEEIAREQIARAEENGSESLITLYIPGTILQTMHWSWNATYSNAEVRNWLFTHVNENPML